MWGGLKGRALTVPTSPTSAVVHMADAVVVGTAAGAFADARGSFAMERTKQTSSSLPVETPTRTKASQLPCCSCRACCCCCCGGVQTKPQAIMKRAFAEGPLAFRSSRQSVPKCSNSTVEASAEQSLGRALAVIAVDVVAVALDVDDNGDATVS